MQRRGLVMDQTTITIATIVVLLILLIAFYPLIKPFLAKQLEAVTSRFGGFG